MPPVELNCLFLFQQIQKSNAALKKAKAKSEQIEKRGDRVHKKNFSSFLPKKLRDNTDLLTFQYKLGDCVPLI